MSEWKPAQRHIDDHGRVWVRYEEARARLEERDAEIERLRRIVDHHTQLLTHRREQLAQRDARIAELENELGTLQAMRGAAIRERADVDLESIVEAAREEGRREALRAALDSVPDKRAQEYGQTMAEDELRRERDEAIDLLDEIAGFAGPIAGTLQDGQWMRRVEDLFARAEKADDNE